MKHIRADVIVIITLVLMGILIVACPLWANTSDSLEQEFANPPDSARPWVYWFFMDGNLTREGITADLESMKKAGIGGAIYMEVGVGIEKGPVEFMSPQWQELLGHAFSEADRLGLQIALAAGPGWCGTGGPWVKPEQSMQHLVASEINVKGPVKFDDVLPKPKPRTPFFGEGTLTPELRKVWKKYYQDVVVLAFPTPSGNTRIADVDEKALYHRAPFSSQPGVKPFLTAPADHEALPSEQCIASGKLIDLSDKLDADGQLNWDVPEGNWTIMRFGATLTGQISRPAPDPGLGLESDKFDTAAIDAHFNAYIETLLQKTGFPQNPGRGLTTLHFDSWEMSSQNWSPKFREEFTKRRGYDPTHFLPAMLGHVVDSAEISERFLWDLRQTAQELVVENHVLRLKELGRNHGLELSIEPYDLNPCSDLKLGSAADVPMCEFWSKNYGFSTEFSCIEATSIAHTMGRPIIGAEAFTAAPGEDWRQHPASMKAQGDWALCAGINRFVFHRYQAQPWLDRFPGMTMGPYGVHWERTETWWDMVDAYHRYITRCQQMLRKGVFVADVLYLAPEGAPNVFRPPSSALQGVLPDRLGYNFDGCAPEILMERASVKDGRIVFPDGMSYRLLVLPRFDTMTPRLLQKVVELVEAGATVVGAPPKKSPSLVDYPKCDQQVQELAAKLWGENNAEAQRTVGKGLVILDTTATSKETEVNPLATAQWIWYPEGNPAASAPPGKCYFHRTIEIENNRTIQSAQATMTADNSFELFVNGQSAGTGNNFTIAQTLDVSALLKPGKNELTVVAENGDNKANPAGMIGALTIHFADGGTTLIHTDHEWSSATNANGAQSPAMELGPFDMPPWNLKGINPSQRDIYPRYEKTAQVLSEMSVPPDFESDGSVRYIHRHDGDTDLYFIASRENQIQTVTCRFRVSGRQPEWWNPITGAHRELPEFSEKDGITMIPMRLEAFESGFVVFRKPVAKTAQTGKNFADLHPIFTLSTPWEVSFDPKWGGPEKITFNTLDDWSKHPEPGIKYYSGKAVYRTTFDCPADIIKNPCTLSLGTVKNMASVKLNGQDLGIAWCEPWRVEIPNGVLKEKDNQLEITVANLWINRLIGDSGLPKNKRLTWTTLDVFKPDSPLQESGLLGPVIIMKNKD
ncbi:MAG TPA: glycosyl hydrolase [Candidatus Hydrogenedentes bacterium]|nr:glycosyl hydrolase [Candidatus Hydrogenedentota bacterium]